MTIAKTSFLLLAISWLTLSGFGQPSTPPPPASVPLPNPATVAKDMDTANYRIHVEWKDAHNETKSLEVLTTAGTFQYDGLQKNSVKINNNDIPVTLKLSGSLKVLSDEKARLQLFLGRTVPYVSSRLGSGAASYSQMSVGLDSTIIVKFGKAVIIQSDDNGKISVLVERIVD